MALTACRKDFFRNAEHSLYALPIDTLKMIYLIFLIDKLMSGSCIEDKAFLGSHGYHKYLCTYINFCMAVSSKGNQSLQGG